MNLPPAKPDGEPPAPSTDAFEMLRLQSDNERLRHICNTYRVELEILRKQLDLSRRNKSGFGSTEDRYQPPRTANARPTAEPNPPEGQKSKA